MTHRPTQPIAAPPPPGSVFFLPPGWNVGLIPPPKPRQRLRAVLAFLKKCVWY